MTEDKKGSRVNMYEWKEITTLNKLNGIHESSKTPIQLAMEAALRKKLHREK